MLSQKFLKVLINTRNNILFPKVLQFSTPSRREGKNTNEEESKDYRDWKSSFNKVSRQPLFEIDPENAFFRFFKKDFDLTPSGIKRNMLIAAEKRSKEAQEFNPKRNEILGSDLGAAHFLIFQGAKIKFKGSDKWICLNLDRKSVDLPDKYDPNFILTAIDASGTTIYYEGLANLQDLPRVTQVSFARCEVFDDWHLDRVAALFPYLKYLDISDCPKVSERGLEALYKTIHLETLIVTNNYKTAAFELSCMMLEDITPGLKVEIREPKETVKYPMNPIM